MGSALAHVMVVGGTRREWRELDGPQWHDHLAGLAASVAAAGGSWLTMQAYEDDHGGAGDGGGAPAVPPRRRHVATAGGRCTIILEPTGDGRERFAAAMRRLPTGSAVDEKTVTAVLYEPADVEPDLVVVLGPSTRLPPSLVWELAYGELVFLPIGLRELRAEHLDSAIEEFHGRRRRFGGLDSGDP